MPSTTRHSSARPAQLTQRPSPLCPAHFSLLHRSLLQSEQLPLTEVISAPHIAAILVAEQIDFGHEADAIYTPAITLWGLLSQVFFAHEQRSCLAAVTRIAALWAMLGRHVCSTNTGAYCRARSKITAPALRRISHEIALRAEEAMRAENVAIINNSDVEREEMIDAQLCAAQTSGRFLLLDGFTVTAADTPENQAEYPQNPAQQPGLGFPILRGVVLLSLATGMLLDAEIGPYSGKGTGETALFWKLLLRLQPGDTLIADSYYCTYWILAACQLRGVTVVMRNHHLRKDDLAAAERLHKNDHEGIWQRPPCPAWMSATDFATMPAEVRVRLVLVHCDVPGQRTQKLAVVTTFFDQRLYSADWIAALYRGRWTVELDIRAIKATLGMDVLRAQSPAMLRTELWSCLLVYNLIRHSMLQAACQGQKSCRQLSFTATLQLLGNLWLASAIVEPTAELQLLRRQQQLEIQVGHRPNRFEPRANKRRPKVLALLNKPRWQARLELLAASDAS